MELVIPEEAWAREDDDDEADSDDAENLKKPKLSRKPTPLG